MTNTCVFGQVLSFSGDPKENPKHVHHFEKGAVCVDDKGLIAWVGDAAAAPKSFENAKIEDFGEQLILPGFVDPHVHFPQYRMLAAPGIDLMDWLHRFTFAEEAKYENPEHCALAAELFLDTLIRFGTTSCMAFSSVHKVAADTLFQAASKRSMALVTGKTMMDRSAPSQVLDTAEQGAKDTQDLVAKWHGKGRNTYAITPRFAVTSTEAQLQLSGELLRDNPTCLMQTHLSESAGEMAIIAKDFPNEPSYTAVYERFGLLGPTSVFGHAIHLSAGEIERLAETGSAIAHCPTSNTFLGSGLMDLKEREDAGIPVGLASDIGGGTSYSMLQTMAEAYKIAMLNGHVLSAQDLYYRATLGNAKILQQGENIGSIAVGKFADLVVLNPEATPVLKRRQVLSETLEDTLFSLMFLGDDRAVSATYVAGQKYT